MVNANNICFCPYLCCCCYFQLVNNKSSSYYMQYYNFIVFTKNSVCIISFLHLLDLLNTSVFLTKNRIARIWHKIQPKLLYLIPCYPFGDHLNNLGYGNKSVIPCKKGLPISQIGLGKGMKIRECGDFPGNLGCYF